MSSKTFINTLKLSSRSEVWVSLADIVKWLNDSGQMQLAMDLVPLFSSTCHPEDRYQPIIDELRQDNDRLREALEFYADPKNAPLDPGIELWPEGEKPFGERARIALRDDSVDQ